MNTIKFLRCLALTCTLALSACATGPKFEKLDQPPTGYGQVYVYRISQVTGAAMSYKVRADADQEYPQHQGTWTNISLSPGTHSIQIRAAFRGQTACGAQVRVEAGKTHFIRTEAYISSTNGMLSTVNCKASVVDAEIALAGLQNLSRAE
jgi:hypothetical protein